MSHISLHRFLSLVFFQLFIPFLFKSCSILWSHVLFGLPHFLLRSRFLPKNLYISAFVPAVFTCSLLFKFLYYIFTYFFFCKNSFYFYFHIQCLVSLVHHFRYLPFYYYSQMFPFNIDWIFVSVCMQYPVCCYYLLFDFFISYLSPLPYI